MGTEKANDLWRTACSSFVVLQAQKAAQPAKQPQQPARQQARGSKQAQQPRQEAPAKAAEPAAASTHKERVALIGQAISKRLESSGGRVQVSTLFPALNRLPEYKVDRQGSGKRPLNYLTSTYGETFHFEEAPDGQAWVSLPGVEAVDKPAGEEAPAEAIETEAQAEPVPAPEAVDEANEAVDSPAPEAAEEEAAVEPEGVDAGQDEAEGYVTPQQIIDRLVEGGFEEEIARRVTEIFADSTSYRAAYNRLRSVFGNNTGRDYYQRAKDILTAGE